MKLHYFINDKEVNFDTWYELWTDAMDLIASHYKWNEIDKMWNSIERASDMLKRDVQSVYKTSRGSVCFGIR